MIKEHHRSVAGLRTGLERFGREVFYMGKQHNLKFSMDRRIRTLEVGPDLAYPIDYGYKIRPYRRFFAFDAFVRQRAG